MRKSKVKKLRRQFIEMNGRSPKKAIIGSGGKLIVADEFRALKKK